MTDREAMKLALEALEQCLYPQPMQIKAITALRQALANEAKEQPTQEPVAWVGSDQTGWEPVSPPQHQPLTLDQLWRVFTRSGLSQFHQRDGIVEYKYEKCIEEFARAIEAKLKEKNA